MRLAQLRTNFTAKHNLQCKCYVFSHPLMSVLMIFIVDHILSHNKVRPFQCGKCEDSFTTPGVANRHRAKCTGSEKNTRRRRSATSVAPPFGTRFHFPMTHCHCPVIFFFSSSYTPLSRLAGSVAPSSGTVLRCCFFASSSGSYHTAIYGAFLLWSLFGGL